MKKLTIFALAAVLVLAFSMPAAALENIFGGYWRTRAVSQQNFSGKQETATATTNPGQDLQRVDTRTRLYWTAAINDKLKFVNKFEMDAVWGNNTAYNQVDYGRIGADSVNIEVKNSYMEVVGGGLWRVGTQPQYLARGFLFDDDAASLLYLYPAETWSIAGVWVKAVEGGTGKDANKADVDALVITPTFHIGETFKINPYWLYQMSDNGAGIGGTQYRLHSNGGGPVGAPVPLGASLGEIAWHTIGLDVDVKLKMVDLWGTFIMQTGDAEVGAVNGPKVDFSGYMGAIGASGNIGPVSLWGRWIYMSGDDDGVGNAGIPNPKTGGAATNNDVNSFVTTLGTSYYWSEIMGFGLMDQQTSAGAPGDFNASFNIGGWNIFGIGAEFMPMEKLSLGLDLWFASVNQDYIFAVTGQGGAGEELGTEIDLRASYQFMDALNLDLVAAMLFTGDQTYYQAPGNPVESEDPFELGAQVSFSF
jgi:hypothetical protein